MTIRVDASSLLVPPPPPSHGIMVNGKWFLKATENGECVARWDLGK
jgi:hypothetical protein